MRILNVKRECERGRDRDREIEIETDHKEKRETRGHIERRKE